MFGAYAIGSGPRGMRMSDQLPEVNPGDPLYRDLQLRGNNRRFVGAPDSVYLVSDRVPVPNDRTGGCYVNWPDVDLLDPQWNQSGTSWANLYHGGNYPRLQEVKRRWDPHRIFDHPLAIEAS